MYSYERMPGGLSGIMDMFNVRSYWSAIKNKIKELQGLGYQISLHQQKLGVAKYNLEQRGLKDLASQLDDEIKKVKDDLDKWWKVKGYIDKYLPQWMAIDGDAKIGPTSGVGVVPIVLAGMALTALAYVVNTGMALLQDYAFKSKLTSAIIEGKMTSGQAAEVLSVPKEKGVLETVVGKVGLGLGFGIPAVLMIGAGLYLMLGTGVLRGMVSGRKEGD